MNEQARLPHPDRDRSLDEVIADFARRVCPGGAYGEIDEWSVYDESFRRVVAWAGETDRFFEGLQPLKEGGREHDRMHAAARQGSPPGHSWHRATPPRPLLESEKHLQDHIHYWPDGRMFIVDEPDTYFNHSCEPNAYIYSASKEYYIIAKADIRSGDEITVDYEIHTTGGDSSWECKCGARNCRGLHKWDFFLLPPNVILISLPFLDPWFAQVHGEKIREILKQELKG